MNKLKSTKINAVFLAIVLVTGTIVAFSPSFMLGAQAEPGYGGMDNNYDTSYGKDNYKSKDNVIVKKVNCNNIDVNVNGLEIDGLPPALSGLAASETDEGERDVNSYGRYDSSGQQSGYDNKNSFKFVCINNNNNTVIGGGEDEEPIPEPDLACEECFATNSTFQTAIEDFLAEFEGLSIFGTITTDGVREIGETFTFAPQIDTIEELCAQIENAAATFGVPLSDELIDFVFSSILGVDAETPESGIDALIECLLEAGIIVDREFPPDSISTFDNGISSGTVQCTGDPLCAKLEQQ